MGMYLTELADVLRGAGCPVTEVPGWQKRGCKVRDSTPDGGLNAVTGGLVHHTAWSADAPGDYPTYNLILTGRPDVPPPLAQLGLGRSGAWYVIAAGRANHAGAVDSVRYSNPQSIGVEAEHPGTTTVWPSIQYASYVRGCAALALWFGITWRGHKEAAIPYGRKIDPTFDMEVFRADVARMVAELRTHARAVQEALVAAGYRVTVDGLIGPESVAVTRTAQGELGLLVDGYPGPVTLAALRDAAIPPARGGIGGGMSPIIVPPVAVPPPTTEEDTMPTTEEIVTALLAAPVATSWGTAPVSQCLRAAAEIEMALTEGGERVRLDDLLARVDAKADAILGEISEGAPDA